MLNKNNWIYFKGRVNILIKWQSPMIFHSKHPLSYYFKNTFIAYFPGKRVVIDLIPVYVCARLLENRLHEQIIKSSFFTFFPNYGLYCNVLLISHVSMLQNCFLTFCTSCNLLSLFWGVSDKYLVKVI